MLGSVPAKTTPQSWTMVNMRTGKRKTIVEKPLAVQEVGVTDRLGEIYVARWTEHLYVVERVFDDLDGPVGDLLRPVR